MLPPVKGEAKSMLSEGHPHRERVRRLFQQAASAMGNQTPFGGDVELEVLVTAPPGHRLPDATNMLGGIGDVLQARVTGADVRPLGTVASVACFDDDAQIRRIHYERAYADGVGYRVVLRALDG